MACNSDKKENIQVFLRVRPLNSQEKKQKSPSVISVLNNKAIEVKDPLGNSNKSFTFDRVFGPHSNQIDIYKEVLHHVIPEVLAGYNCTVFAYGQTGSGKTFTMEGQRSENDHLGWEVDPLCGIIPRCFSQLFDELYIAQMDHTVRVSFLEIYNEELIDLLSSPNDNTKLKLFDDATRKGSVIVNGLEEKTVKSKAEIYQILEKGAAKRQTASTLMNLQSSRSHTIFSIVVHVREVIDDKEFFKTGKLNLVDLAGSENIGRSGAVDKRAREAGNINQSLLTLGRVITSLVEHRPHVPYRESKLTRMLQDSLGGRTKTSIIATVSPAAINFDETVSTLKYASRAKNIVNKPEVNQKMTQEMLLKDYIDELDRLRRDLKAHRNREGITMAEENYNELMLRLKNNDEDISDKINRIRMLEEERDKLEKIIQELQEKSKEDEAKLAQLDEEKFIVEHISKSEQLLLSQAIEVQNVASKAATHVQLLHEKLQRKDLLEQRNLNSLHKFYEHLNQYLDGIINLYQRFLGNHISVQIELKEKIGESLLSLENLVNVVKKGIERISEKSTEIQFDQLDVFLLKNKLLEFFDELMNTVKNDVFARQISTDHFFNSTIMPGLISILTNVQNMEEMIQKYMLTLTENVNAMELLNDSNKQIFCDLLNFCVSMSERFSGINKDYSESLESNNLTLTEQMAKNEILKHLSEKNRLLVDEIHSNVTSNDGFMEEQLIECSSVLSSMKTDLEQSAEDAFLHFGEVQKHICSANNALNLTLHDVESILSHNDSELAEMETDILELFKQNCILSYVRNHTAEMSSGSLEISSCNVAHHIEAVRNSVKETGNCFMQNVLANTQRYKEECSLFKNKLETDASLINQNSRKLFDSNILQDEELLNYIPTGTTPQRNKEYNNIPVLDVKVPKFCFIRPKKVVANVQETESSNCTEHHLILPNHSQLAAPLHERNDQLTDKENQIPSSESSKKKEASHLKRPTPVSKVIKALIEKNA